MNIIFSTLVNLKALSTVALWLTFQGVFLAHAYAQQVPAGSPISSSLMKNGELIDPTNAFSMRIDQPGMTWSVINSQDSYVTTYRGLDHTRRLVYSVAIDRRRYSEITADGAEKSAKGMERMLKEDGWKVLRTTTTPVNIPRSPAFRVVVEAMAPTGGKIQLVSYITSPGYLYNFMIFLPLGASEVEFVDFVRSFRLLRQ